MQTYNVRLESEVFKSFRCQLAANSQDIDSTKKSVHELNINCDLDSDFSVGLIYGSSGSGKTTLAKKIFGDDCFKIIINEGLPIIEQLPQNLDYDSCSKISSGIGLTSVPLWIRPVKTLSNGQRARAEAALLMSGENKIQVIDEWTSVVNREVAKIMSHCAQKYARRNNKMLILLSCHSDVIEWLNPDWIIDCNKSTFTDRRLLRPDERNRTEKLIFDVKTVDSKSWKFFSKYHYLTDKPLGGRVHHFGLFINNDQVGYNCLANYTPFTKKKMIMHITRTVIHPDYAGMGLGILFDTEVSKYGYHKLHYDVRAKFSSIAFFKMMSKHSNWKFLKTDTQIGMMNGTCDRSKRRIFHANNNDGKNAGFRENVKTWTFQFVP